LSIPPSQHSELIRLDGVGVAYRKRNGAFHRSDYWALKDISFSVSSGETLAILGRNGAGKSTLLRLLSDIIRPDRGEVSRTAGLKIALLSIQAGFIQSLTGRQNAVISGITLGLPKRQIDQCIDQIISFSELGEFIDQPVASYSSGMKARLGFSIAIQMDPDILLIDEVISVGDEDFRKKSSAIIHQRVQSDETTVLVTHNANLARSLCTRAIWIENGRVRMDGSAESVIDAYVAG